MQIEKSSEEENVEFLQEVKRGYDWLCSLYEMLTPEQNQKSPDCQELNPESSPKHNFKIIIMNDNLAPKTTDFNFQDLADPHKVSSLERSTFERVFTYDSQLGIYLIKNKYRNGTGFYSLSVELISFYMLNNKEIIDGSNLFEVLKYQTCSDENNLQEVCRNFWKSFVTSLVYMLCYNIVCIMSWLDKIKEDFKEGKALRNINIPFDRKKVFEVKELDELLSFYEDFEQREIKLFTAEFFGGIKGQILSYLETMGAIESNVWALIEIKTNSSYFSFIICTCFLHNEFNIVSGPISKEAPSYIASVKINFDKYIEEIIFNGMDHFKEFVQISKIRNCFFYHWRTLIGYIVTDKNHMMNEMFDEKFHGKLKKLIKKIKSDYDEDLRRISKNQKEEKIRNTISSFINLGLLIMNIPCNFQNRFTQAELIKMIGEAQLDCESDLSNYLRVYA